MFRKIIDRLHWLKRGSFVSFFWFRSIRYNSKMNTFLSMIFFLSFYKRNIILSFCFAGKSHMKVGNHNYFLSWREPWHKFEVCDQIKSSIKYN